MLIAGVDVGGTFTDLVLADTDNRRTVVHKVPSTPGDPASGVLHGLAELCAKAGVEPRTVRHVLHGTTVATNAVLEHKGATTGLVTGAGYRDILHIGRHQRPQNYSIQQEIPWQERPLVKRRHRLTVPERIAPLAPEARAAQGGKLARSETLVPLDEAAVREAARTLREAGVEAIAVCFLFSYLDPRHEERARAIIEEECPGIFVTHSAGVAAQFREFERFTTAAMNAFVGPKVSAYVGDLERALGSAGFAADLHVMSSNGGVVTASMVAERPVLTLLSGPAAGVMGGAWAGALSDRHDVITFDMGGTSADIGIVTAGRFGEATARDTWIAGYPVLVPMIDVHTIGAGGGSIASVDLSGAFRVGPASAGARPGPAAYGHGGTEPTVTDAHVVLGRLDPLNFLDGGMRLDVEAATHAVQRLADRLGLSLEAAAEGVLTLVNANMANAILSRTVQKGIDPRGYALVAFGGAGPLHGADIAAELGIGEVIIPPHPGITSATGLLTTDLKYDAVRTAFQRQGAIDLALLGEDFEAMEQALDAQLARDGVAQGERRFERGADVRYAGQGYELRVAVGAGAFDDAALAGVIEQFHRRHEAEYGHRFPESPVEIVNVRVTARGVMPKLPPPTAATGGGAPEPIRHRPCLFRTAAGLERFTTPFFRRHDLPVGFVLEGPIVLVQLDTTTVVPPGARAAAEPSGNLVIRLGGRP